MVLTHNKGVPLYEMQQGTNCFLSFCFLMFVAECISFDSIIFDIKGQDEVLCRKGDKIPSADFKVGGKKKRKIMHNILPYNVE